MYLGATSFLRAWRRLDVVNGASHGRPEGCTIKVQINYARPIQHVKSSILSKYEDFSAFVNAVYAQDTRRHVHRRNFMWIRMFIYYVFLICMYSRDPISTLWEHVRFLCDSYAL